MRIAEHRLPGLGERVLVNLLSNAIKFSAPESLVTIRTVRVADDMVAFSVVDQGQGFPEEWTDQMLGTSSRAVDSTAASAASAGLGLAFCRLAVERLGGRLWLDGGSDKGAAVAFSLPLAGGRRGRQWLSARCIGVGAFFRCQEQAEISRLSEEDDRP